MLLRREIHYVPCLVVVLFEIMDFNGQCFVPILMHVFIGLTASSIPLSLALVAIFLVAFNVGQNQSKFFLNTLILAVETVFYWFLLVLSCYRDIKDGRSGSTRRDEIKSPARCPAT